MDELIIQKTEYLRLFDVPINTWFKTKVNNGILKILIPKDNEVEERIISNSNNCYLDFFRYPAPYLDSKLELHVCNNGYRTNFKFKIKIKNISKILEYINHDYILINNILSELHYSRYRKQFEKYTSLQTPIYKSKIKMKPSKEINLFDYQLNNIEQLNKITSNIIKIIDSDTIINLTQTEEEPDLPERKVYFDNYNSIFTFNKNFLELKTNGAILADEMGLGKTITMIFPL